MFTGFTVSYTKQILNAWMGFAIYGPGYIKDIQDQKQALPWLEPEHICLSVCLSCKQLSLSSISWHRCDPRQDDKKPPKRQNKNASTETTDRGLS